VLRSVNLPVITVGPEAHLPEAGSEPQPAVLFATTLGETSRPSAVLACRFAAEMRARLVLLTVLPSTSEMQQRGIPSNLDGAASRELAYLADEAWRNTGIAIEHKVAHGLPAIEILAEAAALHARLIVLGAEPHRFFERLAPDRTVHRVLAHARCPVLTLRHAAPEPAEHHVEQMTAN
jgi:nucleotide-binding universal stress UspA family protein